MNTLLEQLIALTSRLSLAAQTPAVMLAELRRFLAAMLIQQNPGNLPVVANPAFDAEINAAAQAGAELAAQLDAAGTRLRFLLQPYLCEETAAERPAQVFGPFIEQRLASPGREVPSPERICAGQIGVIESTRSSDFEISPVRIGRWGETDIGYDGGRPYGTWGVC